MVITNYFYRLSNSVLDFFVGKKISSRGKYWVNILLFIKLYSSYRAFKITHRWHNSSDTVLYFRFFFSFQFSGYFLFTDRWFLQHWSFCYIIYVRVKTYRNIKNKCNICYFLSIWCTFWFCSVKRAFFCHSNSCWFCYAMWRLFIE